MSRRRRWGRWIVVGILAAMTILSVGALVPAAQPASGASRTISAQLERILEEHRHSPARGQAIMVRQGIRIGDRDEITVVVEAARDIRASVARLGGAVEGQYKWYYQVTIPIDRVEELAYEQVGSYLRVPFYASTAGQLPGMATDVGGTVAEMCRELGAFLYHERGYRGQGAKIAVIDVGFAGLEQAIAAGALPADVAERSRDVSGRGFDGGGDPHGTIVAEIIHAMAPDAELYLYRIRTCNDFGVAKEEALAEGVHVINASLAFLEELSFHDGTGFTSSIVQDARAGGVFWVNSAGNYGESHYQAVFSDTTGDGYHDEPIRLDVRGQLRVGDSFTTHLTWDDWPVSSENFDLVLYHDGRRAVISDGLQTPGRPGEPTERIRHVLSAEYPPGVYEVRVKWAGQEPAPEGRAFKIFIDPPGLRPWPIVSEGSLPEPAPAAASFTVGAVSMDDWREGRLRTYSSRGPTTDGRAKPDLVGPDGTLSFNGAVFEGTSAAAPFVAGAAALLLSEDPGRSPEDLERLLKERAWAVPGADPYGVGAGRLLIEARGPNLAVSRVDVEPRVVEADEQVEVLATVTNRGSETAGRSYVALWRAGEVGDFRRTLADVLVPTLAPEEEREVVLRWTVPPDEPSGVRELVVVANAYGHVAEFDRTGNVHAVELTVTRPVPVLDVSEVRLDFTAVEGEDAMLAESLQISNVGRGRLSWRISHDVDWLQVTPSSGELSSVESRDITVRAGIAGLAAGRHQGTLTVDAEGAEGSPIEISVVLSLEEPAALEMSPSTLSFLALEREDVPYTRSLTLTNSGGQPLEWTAAADAPWVRVDPVRGTLHPGVSAALSVTVTSGDLEPGEHTSVVVVTAPGALGSPASLAVTATIAPEFVISEVDFPRSIHADGSEAMGIVEFRSPNHVVRAVFEVVAATDFNGFEFDPREYPSEYEFDQITGVGSFEFRIFSYIPQRVTLALTLYDEEGNKARPEPWTFSFECVE